MKGEIEDGVGREIEKGFWNREGREMERERRKKANGDKEFKWESLKRIKEGSKIGTERRKSEEDTEGKEIDGDPRSHCCFRT